MTNTCSHVAGWYANLGTSLRATFSFFILSALLSAGCRKAQNTDMAIPGDSPIDKEQTGQIAERLRDRIESAGTPPHIVVASDLILASESLPVFYEKRLYEPAWLDHSRLATQAESFLRIVRHADQEGLQPEDYHVRRIDAVLEQMRQPQSMTVDDLVDLDLLFTDAFLVYSSNLLFGKINPETIDPEWFVNRREGNLLDLLQRALEKNDIDGALNSLLPAHAGYGRLKTALAHYREIAARGGWATIPHVSRLQKGDQDERIRPLRQRLVDAGDLDPAVNDSSDIFDQHVEQALRAFQRRHGLAEDGVLGAATLANLNTMVEERLQAVELNLERWRWLPQDLGRRHILVNIANFELDVFDSTDIVLSMRVMVGKDYRRTPVFSDVMSYLVLCPYWHVPPKLAANDLLPLIRKDANYFARQKMRVFQGWGAQAQEIDPNTIDWAHMTAQNLRFHFRQDPGLQNALGRVKFMFPNAFNIYLHDTPARELFARPERAFSAGCIRIEKPLELATYLLSSNPAWDEKRIQSAINRWVEQTVRLPEPMPIHILYWTAWANEDGSINFRRDIYSRDKRLRAALRKEPPHQD